MSQARKIPNRADDEDFILCRGELIKKKKKKLVCLADMFLPVTMSTELIIMIFDYN